jgi:GT2 family glycosyltransferase
MAWNLLRRSETIRRILTPLRLPADINAFDPGYYLYKNPDVALSGVNPLYHYIRYGRAEGHLPSAEARQRSTLQLKDLCDPYSEERLPITSDEAFRISVLTPTFNTEPRYLRQLFQTLRNQHYANWEWVIVDDASMHAPTIATLRELIAADRRVRVMFNPTNLGISGATNVALAAATGHYAALVDHDDLVSRDAFLEIYRDWKLNPTTQLYYTDECKLNAYDELEQFWAKPDWSPVYLENTMSIGHLAIYEIGFLRGVGGFRSKFDGTQDFDLALRASMKSPRVRHMPIFAYLWRITPGSAASDLDEKPYAIERQRRAVLDYARHKAADAEVGPGREAGYWRIKYLLPSPPPLLSYVIPAGGGSRVVRGKRIDLVINCIRSFEKRAFYANCEYIVVHGGNLTERQLRQLQAIPAVVLVENVQCAFNFSQTVNLGVARARGDYVCLLNDDVEAITRRGGEELVGYLATNSTVGAIGPVCLYKNGNVQQNGIVLLTAVGPAHSGFNRPRTFGGQNQILHCRREAFAVGAAVMFVKKSVYEAVGGFSEDLPLNYNDVEFCQRLRARGYSCVVDPAIEVYHYESMTQRGMSVVEQELLFLKHPAMSDPYFSKWFDAGDPNFCLDLRSGNRRGLNFGSWFDRYMAGRAATLKSTDNRCRFSVCVCIHNQPRRFLDDMYKSVLMQSYPNRELLILDNASSKPETLEWLRGAARAAMAKIIRVDASLDTGEVRRKLLESATGDFFITMNAEDFICADALQILAWAIEKNQTTRIFYSDEYEADASSSRKSPFFKPDFDPIMLMNCCYPTGLMAIEADFFRQVAARSDDRASWSHEYGGLLAAVAAGVQPLHVRELLYARRSGRNWKSAAASQRSALAWFLRERRLDTALSVEPNLIEGSAGTWKVTASKRLPNVEILDPQEVWGEQTNLAALVATAMKPGVEWLAILLSPDDPQALLELSAVAWLDPRISAVSGLLTDPNGDTVRWSGGLFLPGGRLFDPYAGRRLSDGGHHGQLWRQRAVDVPAPVNVLIRAKALVRAAARIPESAGADGLMAMLGLLAHEADDFIAVTPHLRDVLPPASLVLPPLDRQGLLLGAAALERGSRWYDGRLNLHPVYGLWDLA